MYAILSRPEGWQFVDHDARTCGPGIATYRSLIENDTSEATVPFTLHLQQSRSTFPQTGRGALIAVLGLCFVSTLAPAIRGYYLVPIAVLLAMGTLVLALEMFERLPVPSETIAVDLEQLTVRDHIGRKLALPSYWTRIKTVRRAPYDVRLILRCRDRSIEIGRCIGFEEPQKVALLIGTALAHVRVEVR